MSSSVYKSGCFLLLIGLSSAACSSSGANDVAQSPGQASTPGSPGAPPASRAYQTDALLFVGDGTWDADITSLESVLKSHGATFTEVNSAQLDSMSVADLEKFGTLIFPGGAGGTEAGSLSEQAHANLREAVQKGGVGYFGICAGAFIADAPAPAAGQDVSYGLGVVDGPILDVYYLENQGTEWAMTQQAFADGTTEDILWYGGPVTPNVKGGVIAKYPDGNPAMSEIESGNGLVVLSGGHPTATQDTLAGLGLTSSDGTHLDTVWKLINAAKTHTPLPAF